MELKEALEIAASAFVQRSFQNRFVHEALKKPDRLMRRICHDIDSVFVSDFLNGKVYFERPGKCFFFELTGRLSTLTWKEAKEFVSMGGGGVLVIDESGRSFFAQSEGFPSQKQFAGGS
jgi:hypothetical protein